MNNEFSTRDVLIKQLESKVTVLEVDLNVYIGDITEMENSNLSGNVFSKCLTMVVLPEPDGAENIISLPFSMNKDNSFC